LKVLFFGELFPDVVHGVSIANRLNLDLLSKVIEVDIIQEKTKVDSVNKASYSKIKELLTAISKIWKQSRVVPYQSFYIVISLSLFGMLKTLLAVHAFSFNAGGGIVMHLHRGDFVVFYHHHWLSRLLIKLCFRRIRRLVVLSENQKQEMAAYFPEDSIFVVENAVLDEANLPAYQTKTVFNNQFIFISNYFKEKGIYDLLAAFLQLERLALTCYGAFNQNESELKALALQHDCITINSTISGQAKFDAIHQADALILPSWNEGQPTVILEAMMVGTPVLTTKVGLISELLGEDYPFYFKANSPQDLADCVLRFKDYSDKLGLSKALQKRYFEDYSQFNHQRRLFNVFNVNQLRLG